ncbi:MAG: sigma-70 family RNA polymerase sigma factor [Opitutaceae bacterium]|nr:sigma-70 family RNA polymerase sigma factor [Opitutaceae bacterium]
MSLPTAALHAPSSQPLPPTSSHSRLHNGRRRTDTDATAASGIRSRDRDRELADSKAEAAYDSGLIKRFNAGEESAFTEIMDRYYGRILGLAYNLLRNRADAEEIAQDAFIRAHRGLAAFRGDSSLATWLYRISLNLARNRYWYFFRRRRQDSISIDRPFGEETGTTLGDFIPADHGDPAQEAVTNEFAELIATCMEKLDSNHREILTMRNSLHLPYEDIARALSINVGTVKSRIARARESLRKLIADTAPEFTPQANAADGTDYFLSSRPAYGCESVAYA